MNHYDLQNLIAFGGLIFSCFCGVIAGITWYVKSERRQYGLERDLGHLKNNYQQLTQALDLMLSEMDRRFDSLEDNIDSLDKVLVEMKSIINLRLKK